MADAAEGSEVTPEASPENAEGAEVETPEAEPEQDWKARARQWEREAKKANAAVEKLSPKAAEYDRLAEASKTDTERAQAAAELAEGRVAAMQERIAAAEIKAALTGIVPDPSAVADDLNLAKFVTAEGDVDASAVTALREKYASFAPTNGAHVPEPTPGQGANTQPRPGQITREALDSMPPADIVAARKAGLLNDVLGIKA